MLDATNHAIAFGKSDVINPRRACAARVTVVVVWVEKEWTRGNHSGARQAARLAKIWGLTGIITGINLIMGFIIIIIYVTAAFPYIFT